MTVNERSEPRTGDPLAMLGRLFAEAPFGMAVLDRDLNFVRVNARFAEIGGLPSDTHPGRPLAEVLPVMGGSLAPALRQVLDSGESHSGTRVEGRSAASAGDSSLWRADAYPLHGAEGEVVGVGVTIFETDEQDRIEGELAAILRQLEGERGRLEEVLRDQEQAQAQLDRLLEREQEARVRAEQAERRARYLADAGAILAESLDYEATLHNVARLVVPELADWSAIDMVGPNGELQRLAVAHVDPEKEQFAVDLQRRYPPRPDASVGASEVIRTGEPQVLPEITDELLSAGAHDSEHLRILRELELRSAMLVPLKARGRTLGVLSLVSSKPDRSYGEHDLVLAQGLAERCALAVDNARLYADRSYIARTLQQSLLPAEMPEIPGVEVTARYRAAGASDVGGDFFDVFEAGDGGWAIAVGDVSGKGAGAAAITALARYTLRAAALYERTPSAVLRFLNAAMLRHELTERFCTVALAVLHEREAGATAVVTSGGHPLPFVVRAGGEVEPVGEPGTLIGVAPELSLSEQSVELEPGDQLVMYTDGVVESRRDGEMLGPEGLAAVLSECANLEPAETAERIERAAVVEADVEGRDDVAVLVVRARGEGPGSRVKDAVERTGGMDEHLNLRVPGGVEAPSVARRALSELETQLDPDLFFSTRLLLTELVTNSVRHAQAGPSDWIGLDVLCSPEGVRVEVSDHGPGFEPRPDQPSPDSDQGRGLLLVDRMADRWGVRDGGARVWFEIDRGGARRQG